MQWLKDHLDELFMMLLELAIGVLLLINAVSLTGTVLSLLGALLLVMALGHGWKYFREEAAQAAEQQDFALALVLLLTGLGAVLHRLWLGELLVLLPLLYGFLILVAGCVKAQRALDRLRLRRPVAWIYGLCCLLTLLLGLLTIWQPFPNTIVLWTFVGVSLIVLALTDAAALVWGDWQSQTGLQAKPESLGAEIAAGPKLHLSSGNERATSEPEPWPQEGQTGPQKRK